MDMLTQKAAKCAVFQFLFSATAGSKVSFIKLLIKLCKQRGFSGTKFISSNIFLLLYFSLKIVFLFCSKKVSVQNKNLCIFNTMMLC